MNAMIKKNGTKKWFDGPIDGMDEGWGNWMG
jgi:hypothetical protein